MRKATVDTYNRDLTYVTSSHTDKYILITPRPKFLGPDAGYDIAGYDEHTEEQWVTTRGSFGEAVTYAKREIVKF